MKWAFSEADMAREVVKELQRQGFETYEEVQCGYSGSRADIVGVRGPVLAVVECKTSLSLRLLDQLQNWRTRANYIIGAYIPAKRSIAAQRLAELEGFGLWSVCGDEIVVSVSPRLQRAYTANLKRYLAPEQRSAEYARAGTQGGYFTPFRRTCDDLLRVVRKTPGIPLRDALQAMTHHYSSEKSAMTSLPGLLRKGVVSGVMLVDGKPLRLFPSTDVGDGQAVDLGTDPIAVQP